jgi:hypothetical protein
VELYVVVCDPEELTTIINRSVHYKESPVKGNGDKTRNVKVDMKYIILNTV